MKKSTLENIGNTIDIIYTLHRGRKIVKGVAKNKQGVASASQLVFIAKLKNARFLSCFFNFERFERDSIIEQE